MSLTDPNLGLNYDWTLGESGWDTGMDANLKRLGAVLIRSAVLVLQMARLRVY